MASITKTEIKRMDEYFRVLNYLSVAQLYLLDNPLLRRELTINDIKPNVVGHWGTTPGQNFVYMHCNSLLYFAPKPPKGRVQWCVVLRTSEPVPLVCNRRDYFGFCPR